MYDRVLFIALIFFIAYLLKLAGVFREEHSKHFINYVLYFSLPALVISEVRKLDLDGNSLSVVAIAWITILGSLFLAFLLGKLLSFESTSLRTLALMSAFGNTAFMGYPFTFAIFGEEGLGYAILYDQLGSFLLVVSVGVFIASGRFSLRGILTFPPFWALILGFTLRDYHIPGTLSVFLEVCGKSLIPVVLFAVGLKFSFSALRSSLKPSFMVLFVKMLLTPLALLLTLKLFFLDSLPYRVALLESSMPPMVMAGVLAMKYGLDERLVVSSITLGILLSFITAPLFVSML